MHLLQEYNLLSQSILRGDLTTHHAPQVGNLIQIPTLAQEGVVGHNIDRCIREDFMHFILKERFYATLLYVFEKILRQTPHIAWHNSNTTN